MSHVYALAEELAAPVVRGYLPLAHANAAILAGIMAAGRAGNLGPYKAADLYKGTRHLFGVHLERVRNQRNATQVEIERCLRPLIAVRRPSNVLFAEAHGVNGGDGFPFDEAEVNYIVKQAMLRSLPSGRRHHG